MICKTCNIEKELNEFYYRLDTKKYRTSCKKTLNLIKNDKIDYQLIYNHNQLVKLFATKVNSKEFTGSEYTEV